MIFLPCTTSLVAYAIIFRSLFANDGLVNYVLVNLGILDKPYNFLTQPFAANGYHIGSFVEMDRI